MDQFNPWGLPLVVAAAAVLFVWIRVTLGPKQKNQNIRIVGWVVIPTILLFVVVPSVLIMLGLF